MNKYYNINVKRVIMEDEEIVKMFNPTLKMRETILFLLILVFFFLS